MFKYEKRIDWFILLVAVVFLVLCSIGPVGASASYQVTNTPVPATVTITAPAPYQPNMPTVSAPVDFTCPIGTPVGYGSVTPNSSWSVMCSSCILTPGTTSTPHATGTVVVGGTVVPSQTPTRTPTVTPGPTITNTPTTGLIAWRRIDQTSAASIKSFTQSCSISADTLSTGFYCDVSGVVNDSNGILDWYSDHSVVIYPSAVGQTVYIYRSFVNAAGATTLTNNFSNQITSPHTTSMVVNSEIGVDTFFHTGYSGGSTGYHNETMRIIFSLLPIYSTPVPTSTPIYTGSYCEAVHSDETGFSWTGISTGATYCFDIGPYEGFDFWGLGSTKEFGFPWLMHICFTDIDVGTLTIFGVSVVLSTLVYVLGVLMLIRNMFVS